jgi:coatomer subunit beta
MMEGDFFIGAALASTLTKLALKYITLTQDKKRQNVSLHHTLSLNSFSTKPCSL